MRIIFDYLQIVFWSITYLLIIYNGFRYKDDNPQMPFIVGALNFAWETNALSVSHGFWGHIVWLLLDTFILCQNIRRLKPRMRYVYISCVALSIAVLFVVFRSQEIDGMGISAFLIDLIIAVEYVVASKKISCHGKVSIAVTRFLGDAFAWIYYAKLSVFVRVVGICVFLLNLLYLCICMEHSSRKNKYRRDAY